MSYSQSLNNFIIRMAKKIAIAYPSNYADEEDYIQTGHLVLARIRKGKRDKRNFFAYAVTTIAREMRRDATEAMYTMSAPYGVKIQARRMEILLFNRKTKQEICRELCITQEIFHRLQLLINSRSWSVLFEEPAQDSESFCIVNDILSSDYLEEKDKVFIRAQFDNDIDSLGLSKKQLWSRMKNIRPKLMRSGYGTVIK